MPSRRARITLALRRQALRISVAEGISAQGHSSLTGLGAGGNAVTFGVALQLGASNATLGWVAAIPMLATCVQLFSANIMHRFPSRKRAVALTSLVARVLFPLCAMPPLVALFPSLDALAVLLFGWAVGNALMAFSVNGWVSWMADLVPARTRARYFSRRTAACSAMGIVASVAGGAWLDAHGRSSSLGLVGVMGAACACGVLCTVLLFLQPEPERVTTERRADTSLHGTVVAPFLDAVRTPGLGGVIAFVGMFGFANGVAAPFWQPFQLEQLGLSYTYVNGLLTLVQGAVSVVALPVWGAVAAKYGHRVVVVLCVALSCTHPLYYLVATGERPWPVLLDSASSGIAWSGYNLCIFNLVLSLARGPRMERLYAVYIAVGGIAQALAAVCSGALVGLFPESLTLLDVTVHQRQQMFLLTMMVRALCLLFFILKVPEGKPGETRAVLVALPTAIKARIGEVRFLPRR